MRWQICEVDGDAVARLCRELNIPSIVARLLILRGVTDPETAQRFLHPALNQLHNPFLLADMKTAVDRLRRALEQREKILVYGDYDVDGTMSVIILLAALRGLGGEVEAYIPHRLNDGYGMRAAIIEEAAAKGIRVVVSVDTGIREHEALNRARELGLDCIVTDHHLPDRHLPPACAILNPQRADSGYPEKVLAGVGVAFKLVQALLGERLSGRLLRSYLKVVAIGTIADVVPLLGENRVIAHFGLEAFRQPSQAGLQALLEVCGLHRCDISAGNLAFRLAPRLNAAGRMEDARDVIDLFTCSDLEKAREIAGRLDRFNRDRQRIEEGILREIVEEMDGHPEKRERHSLVLAGEGWHRGVIGIVAQRVVERYHRPALVVSVEDGIGVGSGRSIRAFHLLDALASMQELFLRYGGHARAAGFALPAERIVELEARFEQYAREILKLEDLEPTLRVDAEVSGHEIDWTLYEALQTLAPFGCANPTPVLAARDLRLVVGPRILQERHLKLRVARGPRSFDAIGWGMAERGATLVAGQTLDLAFTLDQNVFQDTTTLQLVLSEIRG
ncbi:MAG: single-stranded-DNA-specific exonuclease RecJ [Terriglobia bacterium]|jgi:single-stranded-DNA-specific exonuclease